jgi:GntR family transcriptional repressor for pyruvate dehydrogenase complex
MTTTSPAIEMAALDAVAQADLIRRGEVTPAELAEWAIERIGELNPALNAVITPMYEQALATAAAMPATGPLAGVPFLVKDLITEVAGVPFSEGSRFLRGHVSHSDSELVLRLRRAGLVVIVGKTKTPEFGMAPTCEPARNRPPLAVADAANHRRNRNVRHDPSAGLRRYVKLRQTSDDWMMESHGRVNGRWRHGLAVTDEAIEKIKAMIMSGALRAGDRLPREADLAADLGLSRSSLREAVRALSLVNILDVRRGDGTYVTSLEPRLLLEALSFIVDFHRDDTLLEFLRVRRILEPAATAMAAERITDEECDGLRALLDSIGPDPAAEDLVANDLEFHRRIVACSGNSVLSLLLESMSGPTTRARVWRGLTQTGARARTLAEHRAILDALAAHEPEVARSWATVHIAGVEQWLASVP